MKRWLAAQDREASRSVIMATFFKIVQRNSLPIQTQDQSIRLQTFSSIIWFRMQIVLNDQDINFFLSIIKWKLYQPINQLNNDDKYKRAFIKLNYLSICLYNICIIMNCLVCNEPIYRLCFSERCHYTAQFCDNKLCYAYQKHAKCPSVIYDQYSKIQKQIQKNEKQFAARVNIILTEFLQQINSSRNQRIKRRHYQKLGNLFKKLNKARKNKQTYHVFGKEVKEAIQQVEYLGESSTSNHFQRHLKEFTQIMQGFRNKIIEEKDRYFEKIMDQQHQSNQQRLQPSVVQFNPFPTTEEREANMISINQNNIEEQIKQSPSEPKKKRGRPQVVPFKQSQIHDYLTIQDKQFIKETFEKKQVNSITKIYTASAFQNNYSPQAFYSKCGQLKNTLIVAKYKYKNQPPEQQNYYFAGFTPLPWDSQQYTQSSFQSDYDKLSRLFWIKPRMVFPIRTQDRQNRAIYINKEFGLYFGNDLMIRFNKNGIYSRTITIGNRYNNDHLDKQSQQYKKLKEYETKINRQGRIQDYQVYQIEFDQ